MLCIALVFVLASQFWVESSICPFLFLLKMRAIRKLRRWRSSLDSPRRASGLNDDHLLVSPSRGRQSARTQFEYWVICD